jgi:alpha-N-acetylglucosaminidase
MIKAIKVLFTALVISILPMGSALAGTTGTQPAKELIGRLLPRHAGQFICEIIADDNGQDVFEIESKSGKVVLRGNSALSIAVGLNWYLRYTCHCSVSLNGVQLNLPEQLPVVEKKVRQTSWAKSRYFLNYCTFSYSMSWWNWDQWERFIDWMALQGINQPLAVTGQEGVWQAVCRRFGMTDAETDAFLAGPPYLPFSWMGCLDGHGGPLPKDWISQHVELGQKILARERALGMTPVLQGFTGHVPEAILKKFPGTRSQSIHWIAFNTQMLDPQDPLFQKLGSAFLEEQTRLFGTDHLYDADSFIEMTPPSGDLDYLAATGRAIFNGMAQVDPQAVWVLQGWTFMNQASFWHQDRIRAFLDAVPDDHMLVLDLFCEKTPVWNSTQGFYGKPWVWSFICSFGNRVEFPTASLAAFNGLDSTRHHALGKNLKGVGMLMEGFSNNPMIFDLMFELAWRDGTTDIPAWMKNYIHYRYGTENEHAGKAWDLLVAGPYTRSTGGWAATFVMEIPSGNPPHVPCPEAGPAWSEMLKAGIDLSGLETFRHDLVFIARQALNEQALTIHGKVMAAFRNKDQAAHRKAAGEFMMLLSDLDELLGTDPNFLLGSWLEDARQWGRTDEERANLEWNARRILTWWGPGAAIRDYSRREWSGMISGFYARRWEIFFRCQQEALEAGKVLDQDACNSEILRFEDQWAGQHDKYPSSPTGNPVEVAQRLFIKYLAGTQDAK